MDRGDSKVYALCRLLLERAPVYLSEASSCPCIRIATDTRCDLRTLVVKSTSVLKMVRLPELLSHEHEKFDFGPGRAYKGTTSKASLPTSSATIGKEARQNASIGVLSWHVDSQRLSAFRNDSESPQFQQPTARQLDNVVNGQHLRALPYSLPQQCYSPQ